MKRVPEWMAAAAVLFVLLVFPAGRALAQPVFTPTQDPIAGSRVFGSKGCSRCHAVNGVGGAIGPDLGRVARPRSFYELAAAMWNHLPRMAERLREARVAPPRLDARETGDLIGFLYTLDYFDPPGNVQAGRRLFTEKRCILCHQVAGAGGVVGPNLDFLEQFGSPIAIAADMWNHGPAMAEAMRARGIERPSFGDSELRNLIAYLKSAARPQALEVPLYVLPGRADEGERLFRDKRCIQCHAIRGQGARVGPDLAERGLHRSLTDFAAAMWNKAPAMLREMRARGIAVPALQAREMADLVAYLYSVQYFAEGGDPARGRQLLALKGCLACHSLSGTGGRRAGDLARLRGLDAPAAAVAALWSHIGQPEARREAAWPRFRPEEMADLVAFLQDAGRRR